MSIFNKQHEINFQSIWQQSKAVKMKLDCVSAVTSLRDALVKMMAMTAKDNKFKNVSRLKELIDLIRSVSLINLINDTDPNNGNFSRALDQILNIYLQNFRDISDSGNQNLINEIQAFLTQPLREYCDNKPEIDIYRQFIEQVDALFVERRVESVQHRTEQINDEIVVVTGDSILNDALSHYDQNGYFTEIKTIKNGSEEIFQRMCLNIGTTSNAMANKYTIDEIKTKLTRGIAYFKSVNRQELNFEILFGQYFTETLNFLGLIVDAFATHVFSEFEQDRFFQDIKKIMKIKINNESIQTQIFKFKAGMQIRPKGNDYMMGDLEFKQNAINSIVSFFKKIDASPNEQDYKEIQAQSAFEPYWWQREAMLKAAHNNSFIISGCTSGGKTTAGKLIIGRIMSRNPGARFVYCAPTLQLATQVYANIYCEFSKLRHKIAIITTGINIVNDNSSIFIGTPKELRDFFDFRKHEILATNEVGLDRLTKYASQQNMQPVDWLMVDEIHIMDPSYNNNFQGKIEAESVRELLKMISVEQNSRFIGLSASLSDRTIEALRSTINEITGIDIGLIKYDLGNWSLISTPTEDSPIESLIMPQRKFIIGNREIHEADQTTPLELIQVDDIFILNLMFKCIEERKTPSAFLFETESEAIRKLTEFITFVETVTSERESVWTQLKNRYAVRPTPIVYSIDNPVTGRDEIKAVILQQIRQSNSFGTHGVVYPKFYFEQLINDFNARVDEADRLEKDSIVYSIDLYALLSEYVLNSNSNGERGYFTSPVHPFFNFGNYSLNRIDTFNFSENFLQLLNAEQVEIDATKLQKNPLVVLLKKSLMYGIGLITSSVPIAFQIEVARFLRNISGKVSKGIKITGISFVFCDYGMTMGVDYPFSSVAFIRTQLVNITTCEFKQGNGRAGRSIGRKDESGRAVFEESITFLVNIANAQYLTESETLTFESEGISSSFYPPNEIFQALVMLINQCQQNRLILEGSLATAGLLKNLTCFPHIAMLHSDIDKTFLMKREIRELYEICKVICPQIAEKYLQPIFSLLQRESYSVIMKH